MTPDEVVERLDAREDAAVLGEPETEHLDFKEQPYLLSTDKGRWELAKDVAALANSGGGCLVIGIVTTIPADREEEVASEIKPFPAELADVQQMRSTIDATSGVYPVLKRVEIRRLPRGDGKVLAIVRVPAQGEDDLPFVVVRMVEGRREARSRHRHSASQRASHLLGAARPTPPGPQRRPSSPNETSQHR